MKSLFHLAKTNRIMLVNAGSLVGTSAVTTSLGFVYWWLAARRFPPEIVGISSAAISAMTLLGTFCILGVGTLLIGELPRLPGKEGSLISAALILAGGVGGSVGIVFALIAPFISANFQFLRANLGDIVFFSIGVSLTSIALVLDQALIGLLCGGLQLWRNALFAGSKLAVLFLVSLWLSHPTGLTIYMTWTAGNIVSLIALAGFAIVKGKWSGRIQLPRWGLLRKLGPAALEHQIFNVILLAPNLILPLVVTITLSATANAWFYISYMLANFGLLGCFALTTVLYAMNSVQPAALASKTRMTLAISIVIGVLATSVLFLGARQILSLFGHIYAEQAAWSLRLLAFGVFPIIIKDHYVAVCRIQGRISSALLLAAFGLLLEAGLPVLGACIGGLPGLSIGWVSGASIEAILMFPTVYRAIQHTNTSVASVESQQFKLLSESPNIDKGVGS